MARVDDGLQNEQMKTALDKALAGSSDRLETLLARHGGLPMGKPNTRLAEAFAAEIVSRDLKQAVRLLLHFSNLHTSEVDSKGFLPVAATYAWVALIEADKATDAAWNELAEIAADPRLPVRDALHESLTHFALQAGGGDVLVAKTSEWMQVDDYETRTGAMGAVIQVFRERRVLKACKDIDAVFDLWDKILDHIENASRSERRMLPHRRILGELSQTLATTLAVFAAGEKGQHWFAATCQHAQDEDVRAVLSDTIANMRKRGSSLRASLADALAAKLSASAKPIRHADRIRPGIARGKKSRKIR